MKGLLIVTISLVSITSFSQFRNTKLAEEAEGYPAFNPGVAINHKDTKNIVVGASLNRSFSTNDGGATWNESVLTSPDGGGNPVVVSDQKGQMFYFHKTDPGGKGNGSDAWLDHIICQKSGDGGKTWDVGGSFGSNPPKDQDHYSVVVNPKKSVLYTTWTQFDQYGSTDAACQSNIFFSISTNGGTKWSKSVQINQDPGDCSDDDDTAANSSPAVSYDGKLYAAWAKKGMIYMDRSYDGETWLSSDLAVTKQTGGWSLNIPGVGRSNGRPMLAVNVSPTRALGTLYLSYADQKNGENDTDVWFLRSVNRGDNWTSSLKIGKDESGRHQFSPAMCVDQATGYIYIVYYDRRAYDDLQTDVYLSYSIDGGNVFIDAKISEAPFTSSESKTFGGNINVSAAGGVIAAAWTRIDNGKVSVMATVIKGDDLPKK